MSAGQRKLGIALSYANEAVKILTVLVYTPVLLKLLGQSEYGLYQMVTAVVSNLGLLHFGFGSAYVRFFARCKDQDEAARLNGLFLLIFSGLSLLCLFCGGWLTANARLVFGPGLAEPELDRARFLLGILVGNLALTFFNTPFDCHIAARERFGFQNLLRLIQSLLSPFLSLPLLLLGYGSAGLAVVSTLLTALVLLVNFRFCKGKLNMGISLQNPNLGLLKELSAFTFFLFLNQLMDQINWSIDRFLLGRMVDTAAVAVYGIGGQINTMYIQLSTAVCAVFAPKVYRLAASETDNRALTRLMIRVGREQLQILLLALTGFCFFGRPFLRLWAGEGYAGSYTVALLLMVPMTVPLIQNLGLEIQRAKNRHRARSLVYAALAGANLTLSIALIPCWGSVGAAAGTAVTQVLGTLFFMNWYYHRKLDLHMIQFWKAMGCTVLPYLPVIFLGGVVVLRWNIKNWKELLLGAAFYTLAYGAVWLCQRKKGQAEACPHSEDY